MAGCCAQSGGAATTAMPRQLSASEWAAHFHTLEQDGFCIIPAYFDGAAGELAALAAAQHRVLDEWEQVKYDPPAGFSQVAEFPCSELLLNRAMVDHGLINNIGKRWLGTNDVHIRVGLQLARCAGDCLLTRPPPCRLRRPTPAD
jgi:hypothetical protein